jgi:hypothetical protein
MHDHQPQSLHQEQTIQPPTSLSQREMPATTPIHVQARDNEATVETPTPVTNDDIDRPSEDSPIHTPTVQRNVNWAPGTAPPAPDPPPEPTLRRSTRSNFGQFNKSRFHEEFSLFFTEPDPTRACVEQMVGFYATNASDPDTLSYQEAMRAPDSNEFRQSAIKEIEDLIKQGTWKIVNKSDAKDKILPGIWVFKHKRNPGTGEITKHKGRYTLRGDLQEKVFDTFSPFVQWSTIQVRLSDTVN